MKKRDVILIASILAIALLLLIVVQFNQEEGAYVLVRVDGEETARYYLSKNGTYELNGGTNILRIEDGVAYLSDATCPDKLCVHQGKISMTGQTIVCLPNKLTVSVFGTEESVDLVS